MWLWAAQTLFMFGCTKGWCPLLARLSPLFSSQTMELLAARCHTCQSVQSMLCFGPLLSGVGERCTISMVPPHQTRQWMQSATEQLVAASSGWCWALPWLHIHTRSVAEVTSFLSLCCHLRQAVKHRPAGQFFFFFYIYQHFWFPLIYLLMIPALFAIRQLLTFLFSFFSNLFI